MEVQVPDDGVYSITTYPVPNLRADRQPTGFQLSGRIHLNRVEFQAGDKHVIIECNKPIVPSDVPLFVMRKR